MILLEQWSVKAKDEIRGINFGDLNKDGHNEVAFASWDGKIYVVKSQNGASVWTFSSKELEGPAEHVEVLTTNSDEKKLIGTIHKHIVSLDVQNKSMEWYSTLDSWIVAIRKADIDEDGEQEIIATTLNGNTFGVDSTGEKIWSVEGYKKITPNLIQVVDVNYDGVPEIITLGRKPNILRVIGSDGGIINQINLKEEVKSISTIRDDAIGLNAIAVGTEKCIILVEDGKVYRKTIKGGHLPYHMTSGDVNNDGNAELMVSDWKSNSVVVYKIDEDYNITKNSAHKFDGNPIFSKVINLKNGDKSNLLVIGVKATKVGEEDQFYIIPPKGKKKSLTWFAAYQGFAYGDILGENGREFILRTGREEITLMLEVPRMLSPEYVIEGKELEIGYWAPANYNMDASGAVKLLDKKQATRKKYPEVGYVSKVTYTAKTTRPGIGRIKILQRGKRAEITKTVYVVSSKEKKIDGRTPIIIYKEDVIPITLGGKIADIMTPSRIVETNLLNQKGETYLQISTYHEGLLDIPLIIKYKGKKGSEETINLRALVNIPIKVDVKFDDLLLSTDKVQVKIVNNSDMNLKIKISMSEPIDSELVPLEVNPKGKATRTLKIMYEPMNLKEVVTTFLSVEYAGLRVHRLNIPMKLNFVNAEKIKEIVSEIKGTAKGKKLLEVVAEKLGVNEESAKKILSKVKII